LGKATSLTLLERARAREPEAWERLIRLYAPLVASWCACGGVRGADAEDVVQEVFGAAARGLGRFRREQPEDSFRGWLRGITKLKLREHFRRAGRQPRAGGGSASVGLQEVADPTVELPEEDARRSCGTCTGVPCS
jgi:RNA polymerase sigma-70 factor (ECF subfamily)